MTARINLSGRRFGRWLVLGVTKTSNGNMKWSCQCDCGTISNVEGSNLRRGVSSSCGCLHREVISSRREDVIGTKFGRLTVLSEATSQRCGIVTHRVLNVKCDCGVEKTVWLDRLRAGKTKSCGRLSRDNTINRTTKHGDAAGSQTTEYRSWKALITRCENQKIKSYKDYGGRGITVCERWRTSFENFLTDMGRKPSPHHSIDRINNDGNYEPSNCRWATRKEQRANQRPAHRATKSGMLSW